MMNGAVWARSPAADWEFGMPYAAHDTERWDLPPLPELPGERGCVCGEVLRGAKTPENCALFGNVCTPDRPRGPCMVSHEGACNTHFHYAR